MCISQFLVQLSIFYYLWYILLKMCDIVYHMINYDVWKYMDKIILGCYEFKLIWNGIQVMWFRNILYRKPGPLGVNIIQREEHHKVNRGNMLAYLRTPSIMGGSSFCFKRRARRVIMHLLKWRQVEEKRESRNPLKLHVYLASRV